MSTSELDQTQWLDSGPAYGSVGCGLLPCKNNMANESHRECNQILHLFQCFWGNSSFVERSSTCSSVSL